MLQQTECNPPARAAQRLTAANGTAEKPRQSPAPLPKASDKKARQSVRPAMLNFNISSKKKGKDLLFQLVFSPFFSFSFFQRKFSTRKRPQGPSRWERVDTFNSP